MASRKGKIQTVLGPVEPLQLGITLTHEHLLVDFRYSFVEPEDTARKAMAHAPLSMENIGWVRYNWSSNMYNTLLDDEPLAARELGYFKARGGRSVVDATSVGIKRNPGGLARVAKNTGLNIIMGAGYYLAPTHPKDMASRTVESLAAETERDVLEGVDGTGVKAGVIGEVGCSWPWHDNERKALRAAAAASKRTGAPLMVHVGRNEAAPFEIAAELEKARMDLSHTILCHIDRTVFDKRKLVELARTGAYLEFDLFGHEVSGYPFTPDKFMPSDGDRVERVKHLLDAGFAGQVLLAQDICYKHRLVKYGGHGYAHILENVAPRMRNAGVGQPEIDTMLVENPARALAFR
ncbi:MAG: aryldialkylphosphatase [SAR202 cluster bacterium]|nr:aryldialkylphosphatase [SAR202 cluster bacterium]